MTAREGLLAEHVPGPRCLRIQVDDKPVAPGLEDLGTIPTSATVYEVSVCNTLSEMPSMRGRDGE
eukprot:4634833-Pleurochrysis_carterae.AAC.1